ncbi:HAMP domain-containing sensor histidine kinase [Streptomyces sp. ActVer]|uniref:sensor histidine kinase n=1 Tax=Streptomyces sp. ActVer TaxID=3014558 RepID=UPI0022B37379|nr:HAMP domain-containing sensor histidine kinase [Streptomyces sp. ActVer]MCZ4507062.1 HAMP domain-containing sensor histidine kinase [Streptomyces sp. ActVer]
MRLNPRALLRGMPFRARLTVAFSVLFLLAGAALLAFVVLLARYGTAQQVKGIEIRKGEVPSGGGFATVGAQPTDPQGTLPPLVRPRDDFAMIRQMDQTVQAVQDTALRQMVLWSAVGLLVMALLAGLVGRWLAGRALGPVAAMTEATRRISEQNLHQRLALTGPDDELHRLADTFDTMLDRLEKSFESQRRFVANASHELRTPLAVQRTSLEVGLADPLPEGLADVREDLLTANREAERLITALLLLARSDRGLEETETVDLSAAARLVAAELAPQARSGQVDVEVSADRQLKVLGDPVLLRHLLTNLVRNAIQYNHPGGRVRVRLDGRTLTVANTGPPVPTDRVPDLFEPFRRLAQDRVGTTGHGLGLAIVRSIAEAHGTEATAEPGQAGGLAVTVRFP